MQNFLVIIPAHNEEQAIGGLVREIRAQGFPCLVVDDASTDQTARVAAGAGARVMRHPFKLGAWLAIQTGMRFALRYGCSGVVTLDADGQHLPAYIPQLLRPLKEGRSEVVIGSCLRRLSPQRRFTCWFWRKLTGVPVKDLTSGFRAYGPRALAFLCADHHALLDYQDLGVLLALHRSGFKILEVPVEMKDRLQGHSRVFASWWDVFRYLVHTGFLGLAKQGRRLSGE